MSNDPPSSKSPLSKGVFVLLALIISAVSVIAYLYFRYPNFMKSYRSYYHEINYDPFPEITASDRFLIIAPHPDDETLGTGGLISKALQDKAAVMVVVMTDGSASHDYQAFEELIKRDNNPQHHGTLGEIRHLETLRAVKELGLSENNIKFLGYPDGGLRSLFNEYWDDDRTYKANNRFNQSDRSPYDFSYQKAAPYTGANVVRNLEEILRTYQPTTIFYPDDGDFHEDHWAANAFARYAAMKTNYTGKWYTYLVHKGDEWPTPPHYDPRATLTPPYEVSAVGASWMILPLDEDQKNRKEKAVHSHSSQLFLWRDYLLSFVRVNETFADYRYLDIEKVNEGHDFFHDGVPFSSFLDVRNDTQGQGLKTIEDLTSLGMAYDDRHAYLILQVANGFGAGLVNHFHMRIWDQKQFRRMDIKVKQGTAEYELKARDSFIPEEKPGLDVRGNMMVVSIPLKSVYDAYELLLSADVYDEKDEFLIDFTAFRDMSFPEDWVESLTPP